MPAETTSNVAAIATSFFNVSEPTGGSIVTEPIGMFFCVLQFAILQFDESPIPDCTITDTKFCFFAFCNYVIMQSMDPRPKAEGFIECINT